MGMPSAAAWACVACEVATQTTSRPAFTFGPKRSTNLAAVEPDAETELHPRLDELQRTLGGRDLQSVVAHVSSPIAPPCSERVIGATRYRSKDRPSTCT